MRHDEMKDDLSKAITGGTLFAVGFTFMVLVVYALLSAGS